MDVDGRVDFEILRKLFNERIDVLEVAVKLIPERLLELGVQVHRKAKLAIDPIENQKLLLELDIFRLHLVHHLSDHRYDVGEADLAADHDQDTEDLLGGIRRRNIAVADGRNRRDRVVEAGQVQLTVRQRADVL